MTGLEVGFSRAVSPDPRVRYPSKRRGPYVEGVGVGPKERERRLARQLIDRSHRRRSSHRRRRCQRPPWTLGEKAALVLSLAFILAEVVLAVVMFLPEPTLP